MIRNRYPQAIQLTCDTDSNSDKKNKNDGYKSPLTLENLGWLIASTLSCYYTDFIPNLIYNENIYKLWFNLFLIFSIVLFLVVSYLIGYLHLYKHISSDDWESHTPAAIPLATASGVFSGICLTIAVWPIWGILTPVLLFILFMGFISFICLLDIFSFNRMKS